MSSQRKYQGPWRYGICDIFLGLLVIIFPIILLKNFLYAFCYLFLISSLSSLNAVNISKKVPPFSLSSSLINFDEGKSEKTSSKKVERKVFFYKFLWYIQYNLIYTSITNAINI